MKIKELHNQNEEVSAKNLFTGENTKVTALQILKGKALKEHATKSRALLVCLEGKALFENEHSISQEMFPGDSIVIDPNVKHKVTGIENAQLILIR